MIEIIERLRGELPHDKRHYELYVDETVHRYRGRLYNIRAQSRKIGRIIIIRTYFKRREDAQNIVKSIKRHFKSRKVLSYNEIMSLCEDIEVY